MKKKKRQAKAASKPKAKAPAPKKPLKKSAPSESSAARCPVEEDPPTTGELSARQEKFCQLYVRPGEMRASTATAAYLAVYGEVKGAEVSASRLLSNAKVAARIRELQQIDEQASVLSLMEKRRFLRSVVLTPIGEVDERSPLCQSAEYLVTGGIRGELRRGNAERGNEEVEPEMTTVKLKMPCKLKALELDATLAGELKAPPLKVEAGDALLELLGAIRAGK